MAIHVLWFSLPSARMWWNPDLCSSGNKLLTLSCTFPGIIMYSSNADQTSLWEKDPWALARSNHTAATFFCPFLASLMSWHKTLECSKHPENPGISAFCTDVSIYILSTNYPDIRFTSTVINVFPFSFGTKHPSASFHYAGVVPSLQITRNI